MDKVKAREVLDRIDEILRWEQRMESYKDQKFAELGKHLCEVRNQGYWRLGYGSFEAYLAAKFPDCRRKAYYLMSIHDNLRQIPTEEIENLGWSKALELAKIARSQGRKFDSQTWLNKAKESSKQGLRQAVQQFFGEDLEPYEMVYFKLFESQLPIIERALYVASRMAGTERSRGFCLELICADFLAGQAQESSPDEITLVIERLMKLLPPGYLRQVAKQNQNLVCDTQPRNEKSMRSASTPALPPLADQIAEVEG